MIGSEMRSFPGTGAPRIGVRGSNVANVQSLSKVCRNTRSQKTENC